jgi:hypothetical protein
MDEQKTMNDLLEKTRIDIRRFCVDAIRSGITINDVLPLIKKKKTTICLCETDGTPVHIWLESTDKIKTMLTELSYDESESTRFLVYGSGKILGADKISRKDEHEFLKRFPDPLGNAISDGK